MVFEDDKLNISRLLIFKLMNSESWWQQQGQRAISLPCTAPVAHPATPLTSPAGIPCPQEQRSSSPASEQGSRLCTGCSSVLHQPVSGQFPEMAAGQELVGSDLGWLHHAHINKSSRFSYSTHLCLVHLESKLGTGKAPEIPNLVTAWSLSTNNHFTHEILSGNKPQITECMSPIWLPEYPCTKDFHTSVLGISWICLYQLCS